MTLSDNNNDQDQYLNGKCLLAMPGIGDLRFHRAVVYLCNHDQDGAMGFTINHPLPGMQFKHLLDELEIGKDITIDPAALKTPLMNGGPVDTGRGFLIHGDDFRNDQTIDVDDDISITGTIEGLKALANGTGPADRLIVFGYAGWSAGQLDEELQQNTWLVADCSPALLFETPLEARWETALNSLGIDPAMLSASAGQA